VQIIDSHEHAVMKEASEVEENQTSQKHEAGDQQVDNDETRTPSDDITPGAHGNSKE
jgi:hypothetical protein